MSVAASVALGVMAFRGLGYLNMSGRWYVKQWVLSLLPLLVALSTALVLTQSITSAMLVVALTEAACLVIFVLELLKDYLMMRNLQAGRR